MRHAVLLEVQRALVAYGRMQHDGARQLRVGEYVLAGALPVMQHLADHITELVHSRLPQDQQGAFMDEIRRGVARAITELSQVTGEDITGNATMAGPPPPPSVRTTEARVRHEPPPVRKP